MDFFIKCVIFMMVLTFGPIVVYLAIAAVMLVIAAIMPKDKD